ncbi:MAG: peptidoglycan bridge formation glycyltransferase FemA/FemB family protein [Spirochaetales bacterium]|nr:peptidoglycan bridge formation glycyltransferase FemA/FemB family protein [Spirochaetales bacterium]
MNISESLCTVKKAGLESLEQGRHLFQSVFWAEFKTHWGWNAEAFIISTSKEDCPVLMLSKTLGAGKSFGYIPFGPWLSRPEPEILAQAAHEIAALSESRPLFVRFDIPWAIGLETRPPFPPALPSLVKSPVDIQPSSTVILNLELSEDKLLDDMKAKWRYNIRLAMKKQVEIREEDISFLPRWYALYRETSARDKIAIHSFQYYESLLETGKKKGPGFPEFKLFSAFHDNDFLSGIIVARYNNVAIYLYGASSNEKRNLMPNYLIQWKAIQWAKSRGCDSYDFYGIPPEDDPAHPMHGLYRFKTGFGGVILHRFGSYDCVLSKVGYSFYRAAETLRNFYFKVLKKRF